MRISDWSSDVCSSDLRLRRRLRRRARPVQRPHRQGAPSKRGPKHSHVEGSLAGGRAHVATPNTASSSGCPSEGAVTSSATPRELIAKLNEKKAQHFCSASASRANSLNGAGCPHASRSPPGKIGRAHV